MASTMTSGSTSARGDGSFQLPRIVSIHENMSPVALAVADLRGNGLLDLIVAGSESMTLEVLLGNGDGTFQEKQQYSLPETLTALVVSDFNKDGKQDVVAAMETTVDPPTTQTPYLAFLAGDGSGNLRAPIITSESFFDGDPYNISSADVNGDGLPDLLVAGASGTNVTRPDGDNATVYLNNGDGTFTLHQVVDFNDSSDIYLDARFGDVNEDGCLDVLAADVLGAVAVSLGDCTGNFAQPTFVNMGDGLAAVRVVDINGDGHLDIVTSSLVATAFLGTTNGDSLNVAFGDGKGNFSGNRIYNGSAESYSIGIADFNGDGKPDFVTANVDTDTATVYQNDGSGGFGFPQGINNNSEIWSGVSFADLNGDGKTDVFYISLGPGGDYTATALLNDGTGYFASPVKSISSTPESSIQLGDYRLGDFRKTGHMDMLAVGSSISNPAIPAILFQPGNGDGTFGTGTYTSTPGALFTMAIGDFNGDGKLDFVVVNGETGHTLTAFLGNGDGTFCTGKIFEFQ